MHALSNVMLYLYGVYAMMAAEPGGAGGALAPQKNFQYPKSAPFF